MKQGRRIKSNTKPQMSGDKTQKKKKKIIKLFFTFIALIIILIAAYIANDFIILDKNEKTNLVINNNNITANLKNDIIIKDDVIYLSKQDMANFFDRYIYEEKDNNVIVTTYDKKIACIGFEKNVININGSNKKIYAHAENENGTIYLPISEMKDVYGIEIQNIKESNVITIDSTNREQKKAMVSKEVAVKSSTGFLAKTIDRTKKGDYVIVASKNDNGWVKIRTKNGKVGFVKNDSIVNEVTTRNAMKEEKQIDGKVNLVWDYYSEYARSS